MPDWNLTSPPIDVKIQLTGNRNAFGKGIEVDKSDDRSNLRLLSQLEQPIRPIVRTSEYRWAILFVALVMILIPMAYGLFVIAVGFLVYYHAVNHTGLIVLNQGGHVALGTMLLYLVPFFIGVILTLFLLKPLFVRRSRPRVHVRLSRGSEPLLFEAVARICRTVNAPVPSEIELIDSPNAGASFRWGLLGMVTKQLRLSIGLPLISNMDTAQLAGVMAHELGHFSQGWGMRLSILVERINAWLYLTVYTRDWVDQQLEDSAQASWKISWIARLTLLCVELSRRVLFGLMYVGYLFSRKLLRQMEYDADRYQIRLVGAEVFSGSMDVALRVMVAHRAAVDELPTFLQERRLADDFYYQISNRLGYITGDVEDYVRQLFLSRRTLAFDSHPSFHDRVSAAVEQAEGGVLHDTTPATQLLQDYPSVAKRMTRQFYQAQLGPQYSDDLLRNAERVMQIAGLDNAAWESFSRVARNIDFRFRPLGDGSGFSYLQLDLDSAREQVLRLRHEIHLMSENYSLRQKSWDLCRKGRMEVVDSNFLRKAGLEIPDSFFNPPLTTQVQCDARAEELRAEFDWLGTQMRPFEELFWRRILVAVSLVERSSESEMPGRALLQQIVSRQLVCYFALVANQSLIEQAYDQLSALETLMIQSPARSGKRIFAETVRNLESELERHCQQILRTLTQTGYPFDFEEGGVSVAEFLQKQFPQIKTNNQVFDRVYCWLLESQRLAVRNLAQLCWVVEQVDTWLDLPLADEPVSP